MITARQALTLPKDGNKRFVGERGRDATIGQTRRAELTDRQEPFAIILGCSDSRVPAELVFPRRCKAVDHPAAPILEVVRIETV
jgi:carbonic anhydrase